MVSGRSHKPVVTVRLGGGLGNQLFQYAFGRRMSLANGAELIIDASGYENVLRSDPERGVRALGLQHFRIAGILVRRSAAARPQEPWAKRKIRKYWNKMVNLAEQRKPYFLRREVFEAEDKHFRFDQSVYSRPITRNVIFYGYWQTEKYFTEIEPLVRDELAVNEPVQGLNAELARQIQATQAVSIHVRHGDNANAVATALGVLPREYFQKAISQLAQDVPEPHFFVFSDDIPWARQFLTIKFPTIFVAHNGDARNYEDLRLMSFCKHHIVGNSTFSWWGAWLGKRKGQIVYAPRRYYQNIDRPNPDLYPDSWKLI